MKTYYLNALRFIFKYASIQQPNFGEEDCIN